MQTAKKIEQQYTPTPGDVVVLRGLRRYPKDPASEPAGPKIGKLIRQTADGRWFARLRQGDVFGRHEKFTRLGRLVDVGNIERLATMRERTIGAVVSLVAVRP